MSGKPSRVISATTAGVGSAVAFGAVGAGIGAGLAALPQTSRFMADKVVGSGVGQKILGKLPSNIGAIGKGAIVTGAALGAVGLIVGAFKGWGKASDERQSWEARIRIERDMAAAQQQAITH